MNVDKGDVVICERVEGVSDKFKKDNPDIYEKIEFPQIGLTYTIEKFHHYKGANYLAVSLVELNNPKNVYFPLYWFETMK